MKQAITLLFISLLCSSYAQTINIYGSLLNLSNGNQEHITINENKDENIEKIEHFNVGMAFGTSFQKGNKFSYLEFTANFNESYQKDIGYSFQQISTQKRPFKNTYGIRIGKGMKFKQNKKFILSTSVFFYASDQQPGISSENITINNFLEKDKVTTSINYQEQPQEINLALGLRLGVEYYISTRLFINLNFDFAGNYRRLNGTIKSVTTKLNSENEITYKSVTIHDTKRNDFNTRFLITSFSIGFNIWKSRHQHE